MTQEIPLWIVGAGGHAKVVVEAALESGRFPQAVFDDDPATHGRCLLGVPVRGPVPSLDAIMRVGAEIHLAIGSNHVRRHLAEKLDGATFATIRHPSVICAREVEIAEGAFLATAAIVHPATTIAEHTIINTRAVVEHDCRIGAFCHVAPGSVAAGGVILGEGALLGANAVANPYVRIGAFATVGAGAAVVRDVPYGATVAGVPARMLSKK